MGSGICGDDTFAENRRNKNKKENIHISIENNKRKEISNNNSSDIYNVNKDENNTNLLIKGLDNKNKYFCYINSFIQILFHSPFFLDYLIKEKNSPNYNKSDLLKYLIKFSENYDEKYLVNIREIMEKNYNDFQKNKQCDSQDFGSKLIEKIIMEIKCQKDISSIKSNSSQINYLDKYLDEEIPMEKLFTLIECKNEFFSNYQNKFINFSYELVLSLPEISNKKIYLDCLLQKKYNNCKIRKLPKILIITINRAILNERYNKKDIKYPHSLNMQKYYYKSKTVKYKLFALNKKKGNSEDNGHYFCNIKINGTWYLFNDSEVEQIKPENTPGDIVGLFYYKSE